MIKSFRLIMFIRKKRCGRIKARGCTDGRPQRAYIPGENTISPTVATEVLFLTSIIDAKANMCVATCDVYEAFLRIMTRTLIHVKLTSNDKGK